MSRDFNVMERTGRTEDTVEPNQHQQSLHDQTAEDASRRHNALQDAPTEDVSAQTFDMAPSSQPGSHTSPVSTVSMQQQLSPPEDRNREAHQEHDLVATAEDQSPDSGSSRAQLIDHRFQERSLDASIPALHQANSQPCGTYDVMSEPIFSENNSADSIADTIRGTDLHPTAFNDDQPSLWRQFEESLRGMRESVGNFLYPPDRLPRSSAPTALRPRPIATGSRLVIPPGGNNDWLMICCLVLMLFVTFVVCAFAYHFFPLSMCVIIIVMYNLDL